MTCEYEGGILNELRLCLLMIICSQLLQTILTRPWSGSVLTFDGSSERMMKVKQNAEYDWPGKMV